MNAAFLSLDHLYISTNLISPTGGPLRKKTFAFKRNLRGIRGVKPTVQYLCTSNRTKVPTKVLM